MSLSDINKKVKDQHVEEHIESSEAMRDFAIGMADGLTVPFALVAGLSGVLSSTDVIVAAGAAEIAAGTIAMGLGGYLAARTQREHYESEQKREEMEIVVFPEIEVQETSDILVLFGFPKKHLPEVIKAFKKNPIKWRDFMMRFELGLEKPDKKRELYSPITIGAAYTIGGLVPLFPYVMINNDIQLAFQYSIAATVTALLGFGAIKGYFTGVSKIKSALHTTLIGCAAAASAYFIAKLIV
jgi:VIT1/CCC1 family predicted Fe2+/Mn2+ transporter